MEKEIYVLGDIEIGCGTLTDDFISDKYLSKLILNLAKKDTEIDLVLNGDTFDFLKAPYIENNRITYTRYITEQVSLTKLNFMFKAHKQVFDALSEFTRIKKHKLYFIYGNHDLDLVYPGIQKALRDRIKAKSNIFFKVKYNCHQVYAEHGMQYDHLNKANFKKTFLTYKDRTILNISWISFGVISVFLNLKEQHPFMERIMTRPTLLSRYKKVLKVMRIRAVSYLLKSIIYYPWRYLTDPTYRFPKELLGEFYTRLKKSNWDVDTIMDTFKHKKKKMLKKNKVYILGHIHERYFERKDSIIIIHPGSWRDEYDLNKKNILIPRSKAYVKVTVIDNQPKCELIEYPIQRKNINFNAVINNETKYIKQASEEEDYNYSLIEE